MWVFALNWPFDLIMGVGGISRLGTHLYPFLKHTSRYTISMDVKMYSKMPTDFFRHWMAYFSRHTSMDWAPGNNWNFCLGIHSVMIKAISIRSFITYPRIPNCWSGTFDAVGDASSSSTIQHRQQKTIRVADLLLQQWCLCLITKKSNNPLFSQ